MKQLSMSEHNGESNGELTEPCPRCERPSGVAELTEHRGICRFCWKSMNIAHRASHSRANDRRMAEAAESFGQNHGSQHQDGLHSIEFNFNEVDPLLSEIEQAPLDARQQAADLLARIFDYCWRGDGEHRTRTAAARFAVIVRGIRPDIVELNSCEIAAELGVTKQAISKLAVGVEDAFGLKFAHCRSKRGRENMRRAQLLLTGHTPPT